MIVIFFSTGGSSGEGNDSGGNTNNDNTTSYNPGASWFDNIWNALASIPTRLQEMATSVGNFFSSFFNNLGDKLNSLKNGIGDFFSNLGKSIGDFFTDLWNNISDFFKDLPGHIANIWNGFIELLQYINPWSDKFILKIAFVMSEEQEEIHSSNQEEFNTAFKNKIPFVSSLVDTFNTIGERQRNVRSVRSFSSNPLNININGFSYNGGPISYSSSSTDLSFILEKYEPYRVQVRDGLKLIVYGLGIVYLVKFVLNYGITQGANLGVEIASKKDGD